MIHETYYLSDDKLTSLKTYIHGKSYQEDFQIHKRPAIIVLPGGAYAYLADHEAEPVALTFLKEGYNTFVLNYAVGDACIYPRPLEEVSKAIWFIRCHAEEWDINPDAIILMGFSAGACLAAMSATQWITPGLAEKLGAPEEGIKPNAAVIAYGPWDNTNTIQHDPEFYNPDAAKIAKDCTPELDFINYVGRHVPPLFIWHTLYDKFVPTTNPLMIAGKLYEMKMPFELHIYQHGEHGMTVCNNLSSYNAEAKKLNEESPNVKMWVPACINWINRIFGI